MVFRKRTLLIWPLKLSCRCYLWFHTILTFFECVLPPRSAGLRIPYDFENLLAPITSKLFLIKRQSLEIEYGENRLNVVLLNLKYYSKLLSPTLKRAKWSWKLLRCRSEVIRTKAIKYIHSKISLEWKWQNGLEMFMVFWNPLKPFNFLELGTYI